MTKLVVQETVQINAKPDAVWALVGDYNGLYRWHPAIVKSERDDRVRTLTLDNGAEITETLIEQNDTERRYSYRIDDAPIPVADYESEIQVKAGENGGSLVVWGSSFNAAGVDDQEAEAIVRGVYTAGLGNLDKLFN